MATKMLHSHNSLHGRSAAVFTITVLFTSLCSAFVGLRMVSRAAIAKKIAVDDYFILLAWAIAVGITASICYGCAWGLGAQESDIPPSWQENLRTADYVLSVLYQPALMALKTSILAFYLSLPTSNRNFKWACIATLTVVNLGGVALGLFTVFQCTPVGAAFETPPPKDAHCTDIITIYLSSTPLNIITDLAILFLPMPILTGMRLPRKQKIILIVTFSFGAFATLIDVIRLVYLQSASSTRLMQIYSNSDRTYSETYLLTDFSHYASLSFMWTAIEVDVGIMVACVPALKPIVSRFLPNLLRDKADAGSHTGSISMPGPMPNGRTPSSPVHANEGALAEDAEDGPMGLIDFLNVGKKVSTAGPTDDGSMGMMDFLTTPDMTELPAMEPVETAKANTSRDTQSPNMHFFDFVDMDSKKSLVKQTVRESVFPISMVSVLFFIWGFEYGLLNVLNQQFQKVSHMNPTQSTSIHSAYFVGYFFGPLLVGRLVLKHWGFKACYTVGLSIYGCGTLIFWPAAVLTSFPAFVITNFIVAFGLSILEVSANPFIALCGPQQYNEIRLNFSQGIQAIGSVVAPLIADKAFIRQNLHAPSLVDTQWAYLGISLFTICLAVAYYYVPLPEATDEELETADERSDGANKAKIGSVDIVWITLAFGVFAQFCYVGAQEVNGTRFEDYLAVTAPTYDPSNYMAIAHTAFAVGRFLAAGLGFWIKPRVLMLACFLGTIVFEALAMNYKGPTGVAMIIMVFFFEGPLFSLIFAQALRGMGRHTKFASVLITSAVSGGAVFAPISNIVSYKGRGPRYALVVAVAVFAAGTLFPVWLNVSPLARKQCDPPKSARSSDEKILSLPSALRRRRPWNSMFGRKQRDEYAASEWKERPSTE